MRFGLSCWVFALAINPIDAHSQETEQFTYDALGRLVKSEVVGGPNDGMETITTFDPAGNRTQHQTAGANKKIIVLPLNGFTVIPIR
jgi:hypothetical protein